MIQIRGKIIEIREGVDAHSITIQDGKAKSKIKFTPGEVNIDDFQIGEVLTVVIEKESTLFNKKD